MLINDDYDDEFNDNDVYGIHLSFSEIQNRKYVALAQRDEAPQDVRRDCNSGRL